MKLIYSVVFIIIIIIGIYLYLFIQDRKNKGKENKETYLKTKELHDLSRDVHSDNYEISSTSTYDFPQSRRHVSLHSNSIILKRMYKTSFSFK